MAMMRTRTKSRGWQACDATVPAVGSGQESLVAAAQDFARGVPGLKDSILAKRHPLHAGVARRAGAAQEDNSGQDRLDLEEVVAEADRVLEDNGTAKETKAVLRKAQKIYPGKWTLSGLQDELQRKLREFVEEAKAASKGLKEDLVLARQQQASAQRQVETAQQQVEMVMKSLVKAAARLEKAEESGTKEEVKEAKEEVEKAERKVEKAERKVEKAERKVERAEKEVQAAKASGRTKESEADGQQAAIEAILSSSWTVHRPAPMKPALLGRTEAKRELLEYIRGVMDVANSIHWEQGTQPKCSMKATAGVKGIGKTRLLHEMCTTWLNETGAKVGLHVDFNGGSEWDASKGPENAFAQVLLQSAGMRPDDAEWCSAVLPWKKVMRALQQKLGLSKELLVVGVDEVMQLEQKCGTKPCCNFISTLMNTQDASLISGEFPVIFIWTALFESYMKERASQSGRKIATLISLKALPPDSLDRVPQEIRNAFEQTPGRRQLLRQLLGHPRLTFDALQDAFSVCGVPETTFALAQFRMIMISFAKLDQGKSLQSDEVRQWYSPSAIIATGVQDDLVSRGLVQAVQFGNSGHKSVLHPLILQSWAESHREPLANQIKKMFEEDAVIEAAHEKKFETVMLHFDAAVRLALEQESCTLEQLFPGANLKPESLRAVRVMPGLQYSGDAVVELDSFDDVDEVMSSLEYGSIVVSQKRTEKGIEYLVPWTVPRKDHRQLLRSLQPTGPGDKDPNAHLLILGVQTKYVQEFVGKWPSVEDKAKKALAGLQANPKVLQALPVFYTTESTKEGRSLDNPNVYFNEVGLAELLLERTGPLRLFLREAWQASAKQACGLWVKPEAEGKGTDRAPRCKKRCVCVCVAVAGREIFCGVFRLCRLEIQCSCRVLLPCVFSHCQR
ncbi:unnamed protein product [Effrenium voratum]|uniref:Uncharacterized protein n=1 Tax=Effrenium voratum TaxID=2562239 RepID=A0AA36N404_9DINO|nr:unnamed protein product [Effrenium voratum]